MTTITATKRVETGKKTKNFKAEDKMPAVVYGPKHAAESVTVALSDFTRILRAGGEASVIDIEGLDKKIQVLIHEIDRDPVTHLPRHADFYVVEKGAKIDVAVELSFTGESFAVKSGGSLVKVMHELEISADALHLPQVIEIDISTLASIGDQIHVKDIVLPKGVTTKVSGDEVIALVQEVAKEEDAPTLDMASIEVEKKGKVEKESE
jgi:large subunit ribosomal protein L25